MSEIEFPYDPTIVEEGVTIVDAEHHNRQGRQLAAVTDRVNRFWEDDLHRPVPKDPEDKFPLGFNEDRGRYEFFNGTIWVQIPDTVLSTFLGLSDTPASYAGQGGKFVAVNPGATALEFVAAAVSAFLGLSDTPSSYAGQAGRVVAVNAGATGLEFIVPAGATDYAGKFEQDTPPTPGQIPDGKWGFWYKTDTTQMIQIRNRGDVMFGVELNPV
jgi:hypothetical protein